MQHIRLVDNLEAKLKEELEPKLITLVVHDLIDKNTEKTIYKVVKECSLENKILWVLDELEGYAFMKDLDNHGQDDEYAEYKIFIVTNTKLTLIKSLSNKNKIMFNKTESKEYCQLKWSDLQEIQKRKTKL
jgi:hypothetical protein